MTKKPAILAFAGSDRKESVNRKALSIAIEGAKKGGVDVTLLDLKDFPMPLYNGELEQEKGLPDSAKALKELFWSHQGLLIASPEYNSSITPLLKNTIDWVSRPSTANEAMVSCFIDKVAAIISASPGELGGLRSLVTLRSILGNIRVLVLPDQKSIPNAYDAFLPDGKLKDPKQYAGLLSVGENLSKFLLKMT